MAKGIDLNKLGEEINRRKQTKENVLENSGEGSGHGSNVPKKKFLNDLMTTLETGQHTESVDRLNLIEEKVAEKLNEPKVKKNNAPQQSTNETRTPMPEKQNVVSDKERDDKLYEEFKRKQGELKNKFQTGNNQNYNTPNQYEQPQQQGQFVNEDRVVGNVKKIVDGYLSENFSHVIEQTIKDSIIEMYAYERIKDVLTENKDLIKSVVIETIKEIQARKKKT